MYELKFTERAYYDWHNPASLTYDVERIEGPFETMDDAKDWAHNAGVETYEIVQVRA